MGNYSAVIYEKEKQVVRITFNNPDKLNVFGFPGQGGLFDEFYAALAEAENDDDVKVIVIKGSGRAFSAGHDLNTVGFIYGIGKGQQGERRASERARLGVDHNWFEYYRKLFTCRKITIAQVHGICFGEGILIAEMCDLAIAAEDALLAHRDQRMGFAGCGIPTFPHLVLTVGLKKGMELLLTGDEISGKEAERLGLVNKAVPVDKLDEEVQKLTERLCLMPRDGIAIGKATRDLLWDAMGLNAGFNVGYYSHAFFTNLRWEPDEYNFFKQRRNKSTKEAFHARDDRY